MKKCIQEIFLKGLVQNKALVAVYLRHGIKLKGKLIGFDEKTIFLENADSTTQLIFIDSVSTIFPISVY